MWACGWRTPNLVNSLCWGLDQAKIWKWTKSLLWRQGKVIILSPCSLPALASTVILNLFFLQPFFIRSWKTPSWNSKWCFGCICVVIIKEHATSWAWIPSYMQLDLYFERHCWLILLKCLFGLKELLQLRLPFPMRRGSSANSFPHRSICLVRVDRCHETSRPVQRFKWFWTVLFRGFAKWNK